MEFYNILKVFKRAGITNSLALKDVHALTPDPVNMLLHGEKTADVLKDYKIGRFSLESNRITCVFKNRELSPPGVRELSQRSQRDSEIQRRGTGPTTAGGGHVEAEEEMQASVLQPLTSLIICYSSHKKLIQRDREKRGMKNGNYRTHNQMVYLIQR